MKYHFWLCDQDSSQKGQQFLLQWTQVTVYDDTNKPPLIEQMQGTVTGNGSTNGMFVLEHFKDVPGEPSTITESDAVVTPIGSGSTPGNGG